MNKRKRHKAAQHTWRCALMHAIESLELRRLFSSGFVHTTSNAPNDIGPNAATVVGDIAFFAGPTSDQYSTSTGLTVYNSRDGRWYRASLPQASVPGAAASVDGLAIFAGGGSASGLSNAVDIYNTATDRWSTASLSVPRELLAATSVGSLALFAGGIGPGVESNAVDIYNAQSNRWTTAQLSQGRHDLGATSVGNLAFFAGGETATNVSNVVDIYDATTQQWSTAQLSVARDSIAATSVDGLAIFGGGYGDTLSDDQVVDIYNSATGQWSTTRSPVALADSATSIGDDAIFLTQGGPFDVGGGIEIYDAANGVWSAAQLAISMPRSSPSLVAVGDQAMVSGGYYLISSSQSDALPYADFFTQSQPATSSALTGSISLGRRHDVAMLSNAGPDALDTPIYVDVYVSPGRTFGSSAVVLGSVRSQALLNAGNSLTFNVPITVPASLPAGNYHLIATVDSGGQQVQIASTRQVFSLGSAAAKPSAILPSPALPVISPDSSTSWLNDAASVLD